MDKNTAQLSTERFDTLLQVDVVRGATVDYISRPLAILVDLCVDNDERQRRIYGTAIVGVFGLHYDLMQTDPSPRPRMKRLTNGFRSVVLPEEFGIGYVGIFQRLRGDKIHNTSFVQATSESAVHAVKLRKPLENISLQMGAAIRRSLISPDLETFTVRDMTAQEQTGIQEITPVYRYGEVFPVASKS